MIPFYLVTGFLGSGKTTLLKRIIDDYGESQKIGIIQNEFAPANTDGADLKGTGKKFGILEINKGSVFCVCLLAGFIESLNDFIEREEPDIIILEASGLSDPVSIGELLHAPKLSSKIYLAHIWCIVDASKFVQMEPKMTRITHQVKVADTVIINKTELGGDTGTIKKRIAELNPYASVLSASYCEVSFHKILQNNTVKPVAIRRSKELANDEPGDRPNIRSVVLRITKPISEIQLRHFLEEYMPQTYRIKGFVKLSDGTVKAVQTSFENLSTETIEHYTGNTEIIAMGDDIEPRKMRNALIT